MNRTMAVLTALALGIVACQKSGSETEQEINQAQEQASTEITSARVEANKKIAATERDFDKTREDYRHDMQSKLDKLDKDVADLDAKVVTATGSKKADLQAKANALHAQRDAFADDVKALATTPAASWDSTKARVDKEWSDIERTSGKTVW